MTIELPPPTDYPATPGPEREEWHRLARLRADLAVAAAMAENTRLLSLPPPPMSKFELVLDEWRRTPHITGMTDFQRVDHAIDAVEELLKRFPNAAV